MSVNPVDKLVSERERQFNLSGTEWDMSNTPNDWLAIIGRYLFEESRRGGRIPDETAFEESLVKAGAIILAALEHCPIMKKNGHLS